MRSLEKKNFFINQKKMILEVLEKLLLLLFNWFKEYVANKSKLACTLRAMNSLARFY